jgi:steroid 5-alpha reductase family enzyme
MSTLTLLLIVWIGLAVGFAVVFFVGKWGKNFGLVDVAWALSFTPVALFYAFAAEGDLTRRAVIASMAVLWSLRLGWHLGKRVFGHWQKEDGRYEQLRREWGENLNLKMALFFQAQALLVVILSIPFFLAARNEFTTLSVVEWCAIGLWIVAWFGETLADAQLASF